MKKYPVLFVLSLATLCSSVAHAQVMKVTPSQSQVNAVKECMQKNGVVLQEPANGGKVEMTDAQKVIVVACSKPIAQDLASKAVEKK